MSEVITMLCKSVHVFRNAVLSAQLNTLSRQRSCSLLCLSQYFALRSAFSTALFSRWHW